MLFMLHSRNSGILRSNLWFVSVKNWLGVAVWTLFSSNQPELEVDTLSPLTTHAVVVQTNGWCRQFRATCMMLQQTDRRCRQLSAPGLIDLCCRSRVALGGSGCFEAVMVQTFCSFSCLRFGSVFFVTLFKHSCQQ